MNYFVIFRNYQFEVTLSILHYILCCYLAMQYVHQGYHQRTQNIHPQPNTEYIYRIYILSRERLIAIQNILFFAINFSNYTHDTLWYHTKTNYIVSSLTAIQKICSIEFVSLQVKQRCSIIIFITNRKSTYHVIDVQTLIHWGRDRMAAVF